MFSNSTQLKCHEERGCTMKKSEITQTGLFRMSFILQDSSATTTSTYLLKIIEYMLYTANDYLSIPEISDRIQKDLSLEFSDLEIINAINNSPQIVQRGKKYALTPQRLNTLSSMESIETKLISFIRHFIRLSPEITFDEKSFFNLFSRFLYYCFNENKEALLMIIDGNERITDRTHFEASKEECDVINRFLSWENIDKDKLIYQVVSSCYAYCSLTVKKDTLFSQRIFRSKKFFLDANIIFRMAGINRAERQRSVSSFIKICNTLKIQLIYTNSTFSEINRVINNKCKWLQSIAGNTAPLDLSLWEHQEDDFYELYRKWCREPGNRCGDFLAFNNYVQRQVDDVLGRLKQVTIPNYLLRDAQEFNNSCNVLATYKKRHYTRQSLETDINNLMYLVDQRKGEKAENIFSTSTFMISADQNFIAYANDIYDGVQLVVLPSVWLTIMLRFCGRTDDDYKAFVSFMNIRTSEEVIWDIYGILSRLNCYTSDEEVKRRVITEMQQHRDLYPVQDEEECDVSIEKAFDTVVARVKDEHKQALAEETKNLEYDF